MSDQGRTNRPPADRIRRSRRVKVAAPGRLMLSSKLEYPCRSLDVSDSGALIQAQVKGLLGEVVVVYLDNVGRIEGRVVRATNSGFAIEFSAPSVS
ncbi:MAG: PilZ domain-containing protein [Beijerinckiaceae bacterium]